MSVPTYARAAAYQQSSVLTAPPGQLVVMLYDGARRFLFQASSAMREGNGTVAHQRLRRAEDIITELLATLDHEQGGEIASRLAGLYTFFLAELSRARVEQDAGRVDFTHAQLGELREAWASVAAAA
jgi:flagellar secretion chaperone FliS